MAANPNTLVMQETWDKVYQVTHHKVPTYPAFANFRLAAGLQKGDTVNRQYRSALSAEDMGADGSYNRQTLTDTKEQLTIDKEKDVSFYLKTLDEIQSALPVRQKYAYDSTAALFNAIDGDVLGDYDQYTNSVDDGDIGGTAGNGITANTTNVLQLFTSSITKLQLGNIMLSQVAKFSGFRPEDASVQRGVSLLSPQVYGQLLLSLGGKDTVLGDQVSINGHAGRYMGFDIFVSNGLGWSGVLSLATNPTSGDTIVINGVTLTFLDSSFDASSSAEGSLRIGTAVDDTRENLENALNALTTDIAESATAGFVGFTVNSASHNALKGITAVNTNTADTLAIKMTGRGYVAVSDTLSDTTDCWTATKQIQHLLFGVNNSIDVVVQKTPTLTVKDRDGYVGFDIVTWCAYGKKVFNEQKPMMIDVQVRTDAY